MANQFTYKVDENLVVRVFDANSATDEPVAIQPHWPDATPWASLKQATDWAKLVAGGLNDPESEFIAGFSPDEPKLSRPPYVEPEPFVMPDLTAETE